MYTCDTSNKLTALMRRADATMGAVETINGIVVQCGVRIQKHGLKRVPAYYFKVDGKKAKFSEVVEIVNCK